jgi:hypothetical protein
VRLNCGQKAVILAHSMSGNVMLHLMRQQRFQEWRCEHRLLCGYLLDEVVTDNCYKERAAALHLSQHLELCRKAPGVHNSLLKLGCKTPACQAYGLNYLTFTASWYVLLQPLVTTLAGSRTSKLSFFQCLT